MASFQLTTEIVARLGDHGCQNITNQLNLPTCSVYPMSNGGFGDVYRGKLIDGSQVAIKTMRIYINTNEAQKPLKVSSFVVLPCDTHMTQIKNAARELYTWSRCQHPNVHRLLGLVVFRDQIGMVSNWAEEGNLPSYLRRHPDADRYQMVQLSCQAFSCQVQLTRSFLEYCDM